MKIGIKTYHDEKILEVFRDKADFFEIMAVRGKDYSFLKKFQNPMIIHAEHQLFGINPADKANKINLESINFAIKIADFVGSKKIILHTGTLIGKDDSKENAISFISSLNDKRILIENMPKGEKYNFLCCLPEEIKEFIKGTDKGFCLDISHAISTAVLVKKNYVDFIKEFIKLKPIHYHLSGIKLKGKITEHLSLEKSEVELKEIFNLLPKDAEITLETEQDMNKLKRDIEIVEDLKNNDRKRFNK